MMLPSTGKFKEINCPFFNSTLCERPYCHFRHVKKDSCDTLSPVNSSLALGENGEILQQLVSEAVRKVLQRTEILPGALATTSGTSPVESVSDSLVNKVVEELAPPLSVSNPSQNPSNVFPSQSKIPSYKPTPISVLKRRHIPIPYSPSLSKNSSVLRKRTNSDDSVSVLKKVRSDSVDINGFENEKNATATRVNASPSCSRKELPSDENVLEVSQYSPAPVCGWKSSSLLYTPSSIESLSSQQNTYVPSSRTSVQSSVVNYEPSDKSVSVGEPTYEPLAANGLSVEEASYEPSTISNSEPEYQPIFTQSNTKEYVPTDISKLENISTLDFSTEIDLLHDILHKELEGGDLEDHDCLLDVAQSKSLLDSRDSVVENKSKGDGAKRRSGSSKAKNEDRRQSENEKKKSESSSSSSKKRTESDKKKEEGKRREEAEKKSENRKKKEHEKKKNSNEKESAEGKKKENDKKESEKKKSDHDRKKSCETKRTESERKKCEDDKKKGETEKKQKHSEGEKKGEETSKKHTENEKKSDTNKKRSDNKKYVSERRHSDCEKRGESDRKHGESDKRSDSPCHKKVSNSDNQSKHASRKRDEKKHSATKNSVSASSGISDNKKVHSKQSKMDTVSSKAVRKRKRSSSTDREKNSKLKSDSKHKIDHESRRGILKFSEYMTENDHGNFVSDSESEVLDALDDVTLPNDSWASSSDEETITKECFRIFQEYDPSIVKKKVPSYKPPAPVEDTDALVVRKIRVAHDGADSSKSLRPGPPKRPSLMKPSRVLSDRLLKIKEAHNAQMTSAASTSIVIPVTQQTSETKATAVPPNPISSGKVRIAHVPNVNILLNAKLKMQQQLKERQLNSPAVKKPVDLALTKAQTVSKGSQRVAHMPSERTLSRPVIHDVGGKIPGNVRQRYLNTLVDEYLKIYPVEQDAFEKAQEEEQNIHAKSTTRSLYMSHVSNTISRLRKSHINAGADVKNDGSKQFINRTVSHTSMLAGKGGSKGSWSIEKPRKPPPSVTGKSLYEQFAQFVMTEDQLKQNGFPTAHAEEKGVAEIHAFYKKPFIPKTPSQRQCARCYSVYYVNKQGKSIKDEQCIYHWGRLFQSKTRGGWEARYNCCQGHGEAVGCSVGSCHVSDNFDPSNLRGFVKTLPKDNLPPGRNHGIYALDCEMCYTTVGLELTRVTVIGTDFHIVYETLVKPESPILDYNTRFSGITEEDLAEVTTSIYEVQSVLLSFVNDKTILVGHSLESDFKALKLIHPTVVDTSVVYPHKMGPPKKRALKSLCRELLHKIIQENEGGHDSAEDAKAAMEVMLFKIKEDMKSW